MTRTRPARLSLLLGAAALLSTSTLTACLDRSPEPDVPVRAEPPAESPALPEGKYALQSLAYDDASGVYQAFLVDPPAGSRPVFQTSNLRMAQLTDEEVAAGERTHIAVDAEGPIAKLTPDFQIAFTHNVTEDRVNPATGQTEPVVVRQESSMWSPFMAGMTGAMIGNMLFAPRYYYPPPYAGGVMGGFGGAGATREMAGRDFQGRHGQLPQPARLSQSGYSKAPSSSLKSTGAGAGSSRLKSAPVTSRPKAKPFGGGRGFGRRR